MGVGERGCRLRQLGSTPVVMRDVPCGGGWRRGRGAEVPLELSGRWRPLNPREGWWEGTGLLIETTRMYPCGQQWRERGCCLVAGSGGAARAQPVTETEARPGGRAET